MRTGLTTKEVAKEVRGELKKVLPHCKFSVTTEQYAFSSRLNIALISAPFDVFIDKSIKPIKILNYNDLIQYIGNYEGYINDKYTVKLTREAFDALTKALQIVLKYYWDESDPQTDYYNCAFFINLMVGTWGKPFVKKEA
jgi:hypothetical protein